MQRHVYNGLVVPAAKLGLRAGSRVNAKLRRGVEARQTLFDRWSRAVAERSRGTPVVWFHAASAGEALQARPLIDGLRDAHPDATLWMTHFSPSAENVARAWDALDAVDYVPWDTARDMRDLVSLLGPEAVIVVGAETWPNLVWAAARPGIRLAQVSCRVASSRRLRWPLRGLNRSIYERFDAIGTVADEDLRALIELGVEPAALETTGDTRVDAVLTRAQQASAAPLHWRPASSARVIVAGSTWPSDEAVLLPAVAALSRRHPGLVTIVAPHEPTPAAVTRVRDACVALGLDATPLADLAGSPAGGVVILDRVGMLYGVYGIADLAFVGGGFDGSVHNTMEPAALGAPVAIGPRHGDPHEVERFAAAGALAVVTDSAELVDHWGAMLAGADRRDRAAEAARATMASMAGATGRTLAFLRRREFPI